MVCLGTLFIGDNMAFLCIPMKTGVKSEHCLKGARAGDGADHRARDVGWDGRRRQLAPAGRDGSQGNRKLQAPHP